MNFERIIRRILGNTGIIINVDAFISKVDEELHHEFKGYQHVVTLTEDNLNPKYKLVGIAFEDNEVTLEMLEPKHFNVPLKLFFQAATIIFQTGRDYKVMKHRAMLLNVPKK